MIAGSNRKMLWRSLVGFTIVALAGCASVDRGAAQTKVGGAQNAISQAERVNAREYAAMELATAEQQLDSARKSLEEKDYVKADHLADQASVNAELAEAKAESSKTKGIVQTLQKSINELHQEIDQNAGVKP